MTDDNPSTWIYYDWADTQRESIVPEDAVGLGIVMLFVGLAPFAAIALGVYLLAVGVARIAIDHITGRKRNRSRFGMFE